MAEQANRAILDKARCIFAQANLSPRYWAEAVCTATDLCNILPSATRGFTILYATWFGQPFKLDKLKTFGCLCYVFIPEQFRKDKLSPTAKKGIFLGYSSDFSAY